MYRLKRLARDAGRLLRTDGSLRLANGGTGNSTTISLQTGATGETITTTDDIAAGYFIGDGSLLTGITTGASYAALTDGTNAVKTQLQNSVANVVTNGTGNQTNAYWAFTNSTTAEIQAALDAGKQVWLYPGSYTLTNLFFRTNGCAIRGLSAESTTINFPATATNLFNFAMKTATNASFTWGGASGFTLDGGESATSWSGNAKGITLPLQYPNMIIGGNTWYVNRNGLFVNVHAGGSVYGIKITGFSGYGLFMMNQSMGLDTTYTQPNTIIGRVNCEKNYIGAWLAGWAYDFFPNDGTGGDRQAEYVQLINCQFNYNTIGLGAGAGNHTIIGNNINGNWVGVFLPSAINNAHSQIIANHLNHNTYWIWAYNTSNGEDIFHNSIKGGGDGWFDSVAQVKIIGNVFESGAAQRITFTNAVTSSRSGFNFVRDNFYQGTWGTDFIVVQNNPTATNEIRGNRSSTLNNNDGSYDLPGIGQTNYYSSSDLNPGTGWTKLNPNGASAAPTYSSEGLKRTASGTHYLHIPLHRWTTNVTVNWIIQSDVVNAVTNTYQCWYFPLDGTARVNSFGGGTTSNLVLTLPVGLTQISYTFPITPTNTIKEMQMTWPAATNTAGVIAIIGLTEVIER